MGRNVQRLDMQRGKCSALGMNWGGLIGDWSGNLPDLI
jgi:hypothetical protein